MAMEDVADLVAKFVALSFFPPFTHPLASINALRPAVLPSVDRQKSEEVIILPCERMSARPSLSPIPNPYSPTTYDLLPTFYIIFIFILLRSICTQSIGTLGS